MDLTCDTCGRIGNEDDGIEADGPCQEPCDGIVRYLDPMHPDDDLHVILDALGELLDQIDRDEAHPWEEYDGDRKACRDGYLEVLDQAKFAVERELSKSDGLRFSKGDNDESS